MFLSIAGLVEIITMMGESLYFPLFLQRQNEGSNLFIWDLSVLASPALQDLEIFSVGSL